VEARHARVLEHVRPALTSTHLMKRALVLLFVGAAACPAPSQPATAPATPGAQKPDDGDSDFAEVAASGAKERELIVDTGDLDAIIARKALRVLTFGGGELMLPRAGTSTATDRELAAAFAHNLKVDIVPIAVASYGELIPMLLAGKGDIVAARMADTDERSKLVAFSRPTAVVAELLVARKGDASAPTTLTALANKSITVRKSSSYRETLDQLAASVGQGLVVADAPEERDTEGLVHDVAAGKIPYTVCDSDLFAHIQAFTPDVEAILPLKEGRQIAFALRKTNPKLKAAADAFLVQSALTTHAKKLNTGDLDQIKKRGSLRMLTRNNAVSYFLHQGKQRGFDYELMKMFARDQGLRLDVIVPSDASEMLPWLLEGRGDIAAAQLTITEERKKTIAFSEPYLLAQEVLVQHARDPPITKLEELSGKTIHVRKSSSYHSTLAPLATRYHFTVVDAPEDQETEQLIGMVGRKEIPLTVADQNIAAVELTYRNDVQTTLVVQADRQIGYGVRPGNQALRAALDAFVKKKHRGLEYNVLKKQYFENKKNIEVARQHDARATGALSPYDDLIKDRSRQYGLDWRLMAAQAYQESRFDPDARSWVGALGLFQVMPATGSEMGFLNLTDPDEGTHAGVKYMAKLIDQFERDLPFKQRVRFALASYNAGKGHVQDARRLAQERGLNPDKWFGNVEKTMLLLAEPKYSRKARHGYCRGEEPVKYVSEIQSRYDNYLAVVKDFGVATDAGR
jgi:membrane-bound lytic murein transglycosylase F